MVADEVRSTVQAILFLKATDIESMPQKDSTGKVIGVKGTVDELAAADAKYVSRPNLSDIATIDLANKEKSIKQATMSVDISPDIFRASDPSSASIKLLFTDVLIWCKNEFTELYPGLVDFVEVFKQLVARIEVKHREIASMRTSCGVDFWIPQNDSEVLKREIDPVTARIKSRKAAMSDVGNSHIEDYEQIRKEWEEELEMKAKIPAEAKAEVEKEYGEPSEVIEVNESKREQRGNTAMKVDNRLSGKSIVDG